MMRYSTTNKRVVVQESVMAEIDREQPGLSPQTGPLLC